MCSKLTTKPDYSCRVTSVYMTNPNDPTSNMKIKIQTKNTVLAKTISEQEFSHVISTIPFSALRSVDISGCNLEYKQRMALRCLNYGPSVKVGIKFKTRWWQTDEFGKQMGGQSSTDRPSRVIVYPSYGTDDPVDKPGVLIAPYNWFVCHLYSLGAELLTSYIRTQDSLRFAPFIEIKDWSDNELPPDRPHPPYEERLLDQIYQDLAAIHGKPPAWFKEQTCDYYAFDWIGSLETVGAFAYFGPGQFSSIYPTITTPAASGNFHFGGEVASKHHAWVAGALESAERCVDEIRRREKNVTVVINYPEHAAFKDTADAVGQYLRGVYANELAAAK